MVSISMQTSHLQVVKDHNSYDWVISRLWVDIREISKATLPFATSILDIWLQNSKHHDAITWNIQNAYIIYYIHIYKHKYIYSRPLQSDVFFNTGMTHLKYESTKRNSLSPRSCIIDALRDSGLNSSLVTCTFTTKPYKSGLILNAIICLPSANTYQQY